MYAIIKRPGEKPVEEAIEFTPEFFKEYFGDVVTGTYCIGFLGVNVYFVLDPKTEPANFTLWDISFYGNVLITGGKPNGEPCSIDPKDARFIKTYIKSYEAPKKRTRFKEVTICDY